MNRVGYCSARASERTRLIEERYALPDRRTPFPTLRDCLGNPGDSEYRCLHRSKMQAAIVTLLSDMDFDLHALESRLAKSLGLVEGIMQELLTGKTRLV